MLSMVLELLMRVRLVWLLCSSYSVLLMVWVEEV